MAIKIYGDPGSGSRRRVTSAAAAMGIDIEIVDIDLFKGESHTPEFLQLNPHGLSPAMVDGDFVLYESAAINLYLAEKAGSDLAGTTTRERFEILQWMFWSGEQWRIFATLTFDEVLGKRFMGQPADETIVKEHHDNDGPGIAVKIPTPGVEVRDRDSGCTSKTVHKENDEGDSKTVHTTNCD